MSATPGPLSLLLVLPACGSGKSCQGRACFWRGLRTLDNFYPIRTIEVEGKGAGGLRGFTPWRSLRQSLIGSPLLRACAGPHESIVQYPIPFPSGLHDPHRLLRLVFRPLVARPASIRILVAFLGATCKIRSFE